MVDPCEGCDRPVDERDARTDEDMDASDERDAPSDEDEDDAGDARTDGDVAANDGEVPDACVACPGPSVVGIDFEPLRTVTASGQNVPSMELLGLLFMPDGSVLLYEKSGRVGHYQRVGDELVLQSETLLPLVFTRADCGLLAAALDPDWEENHYFYVAQCISDQSGAVFRYEWEGGDLTDVGATNTLVIEAGDPDTMKARHNVGSIGFFDDDERSMWVLFGDKQTAENAQEMQNLGAVLRIIPRRGEGSSGYDPHPENPFAGGDPEETSGPDIYAWGLRSPFRGSIDSKNRILIGDVGYAVEEINLATEPGQNFGWGKVKDGPCQSDCDGLVDPLISYNRVSTHEYVAQDPDAVASAARCTFVGTTYRPNDRDRYKGFLDDSALLSDMCVGYVRAISVGDDNTVVRDVHAGHLVGLTSTAQGPDGYFYVTSFGSCTSSSQGIGSGVYRAVPRYEGDEPEPRDAGSSSDPIVDDPLGPMPDFISQTGIFEGEDNTTPIERVIRYEPTLELYTNGADKERWLLLPEGAQVDTGTRDAWEFPDGTLFWKTFSYLNNDGDRQRVETRVIRKTSDGYDYHVYAWDENGEDAQLLALQRTVLVDVYEPPDDTLFMHGIPSGFDCRSCHESNETVIIGFDELRLNGPGAGHSGSQLEALAEAGVFSDPIPSDPDAISVADEATRDVVGYLHGNCAHCHNASPRTMSILSLEHTVAVTNIVGMETQASGQADGIRVVPGSPETSVLFQAFSGEVGDEEVLPMPPIGVQRVDAAAVEMLRAWVAGLATP
jgi:hypothetical protein